MQCRIRQAFLGTMALPGGAQPTQIELGLAPLQSPDQGACRDDGALLTGPLISPQIELQNDVSLVEGQMFGTLLQKASKLTELARRAQRL